MRRAVSAKSSGRPVGSSAPLGLGFVPQTSNKLNVVSVVFVFRWKSQSESDPRVTIEGAKPRAESYVCVMDDITLAVPVLVIYYDGSFIVPRFRSEPSPQYDSLQRR